MDLFDQNLQQSRKRLGPLAHRMRPDTLDEFVGQEHLLAPEQPLYLAITKDMVMSCIFWGPPGCGKTTLAQIIAQCTKAYFEHVNASTTGVPELRKQVAQAEERPSCSWTRFTASIKHNRTFYSPSWKMARLC